MRRQRLFVRGNVVFMKMGPSKYWAWTFAQHSQAYAFYLKLKIKDITVREINIDSKK